MCYVLVSLLLNLLVLQNFCHAFNAKPPLVSPATGLPNQIYEWRNQKIRFQVSETISPDNNNKNGNSDVQNIVLVHGLFVNADHWRKILTQKFPNTRIFAIDLLGSGYSSKPPKDSKEALLLNGENLRFEENSMNESEDIFSRKQKIKETKSAIVKDATLGTASGNKSRISDIELRHPLQSCYNFFTWSELISDFTSEVVLSSDNNKEDKAILVCNSIGTISSLQAILDTPELYEGAFVVAPNFRELHVAEVPFANIAMPLIRKVQQLLRENGKPLFDSLAKPNTVKEILKEPYAIQNEVDDELVKVLLDPLLTEGAADVVFDTLSYSAGPLPEQQLSDKNFPSNIPVWITYGDKGKIHIVM